MLKRGMTVLRALVFTLALMLTMVPQVNAFTDGSRDGASQKRAKRIFRQLRCQICNGQDINDSMTVLAQSIRQEVYSQISMQKSDGEILQHIQRRYGKSVLKGGTPIPFVVFASSFVVLLIFILIRVFVRRRTRSFIRSFILNAK